MKWFCLGSLQSRPCMNCLHWHCPLITSQLLFKEPPGSHAHIVQPSLLSDNPYVSSMHWLQSRPVTNLLQVHSPVLKLHPELLTVPKMLQVHIWQPSGLASSKFQNPSLQMSHRRPLTWVLQWQAPASTPCSIFVTESHTPSSREPRGSQSQAESLNYIYFIMNIYKRIYKMLTFCKHEDFEYLRKDLCRRKSCTLHNAVPQYCAGNCHTLHHLCAQNVRIRLDQNGS